VGKQLFWQCSGYEIRGSVDRTVSRYRLTRIGTRRR